MQTIFSRAVFCFIIFSFLLCPSQLYSNSLSSPFRLNSVNLEIETANEDYRSLWDKVVQFEKESLPKSALEVVNEIYRKASEERNAPERIKAIIYRMKCEMAIDNDKLPEMIKEIEQLASTSDNAVEQSLLYSICAELYSDYYLDNRHSIDQRTDLINYVPEDIREWTKNIFLETVERFLDLSIQNADVLQNTPIEDYRIILVGGNYFRRIRPTVYDFLIHYSVNLLNSLQGQKDFTTKVESLYDSLIAFREKVGDPEPLFFAKLHRLEYIYQNPTTDNEMQNYTTELKKLKKEYNSFDFSVEVIFKEATSYINSSHSYYGDKDLDKKNELIKKCNELCLDGIKRFPKYIRIGILQDLLAQITQSYFEVLTDNSVYPGHSLNLKIKSRNVNKVTIEIYKINTPISEYINTWSRQGAYKTSGKLFLRKELNLINEQPYLSSDTIYSIVMKDLGSYEYVIYADGMEKDPANKQFSVTHLATFSTGLLGERQYLVVDRMTGKPIKGATINFYERASSGVNRKVKESAATDKLGLASGSPSRNFSAYNVSYGNDTALILSNVPFVSSANIEDADQVILSVLTDRSIYRPGQTVHFKGIAYETRYNTSAQDINPMPEIVAGEKFSVSLYDPNSKQLQTSEFTTNEFGSFSGEFTLPQGLLNGRFSIRSEKGSAWQAISVEEYKRPTFDIQFKENTETYLLGDSVQIEGIVKSFSGVSVSDTELTYRITRQSQWSPIYENRGYNAPVQIDAGTVKTDESGNFSFNFLAEKGEYSLLRSYFAFTVEASLTDSKGETQTKSTTIRIGEKSMLLSFSGFSTLLLKENLPALRIKATNLSMKAIKAKGEYKIYQLNAAKEGDEEISSNIEYNLKSYTLGKLVFSGAFNTEENLPAELLEKLSSGAYRIIAYSKDDLGRDVEAEMNFGLGSNKDKKPPVKTAKWILTPKTTCEVGEKAEIVFGSSLKVNVLYQLFHEGKQISASRFELNDQNRKIEIPFLQSYGKGISASFIFVKDGESYSQKVDILRKQEDKKLTLKLETFRDRLTPGQKEEWTISVKDGSNNPVVSELLAAMYDASLDKIRSHTWDFIPMPAVRLRELYLHRGNEFLSSRSSQSKDEKLHHLPDLSFDSFNWFGWRMYWQMNMKRSSMDFNITLSEPPIMMTKENKVIVMEDFVADEYDSTIYGASDILSAQGSKEDPIQIRQNFNETAFFYPQLKTNEAGETLISFTLPESNTTWKFMALSHTKDLKYGQLLQEMISQKQLMISPNMPRFIREGDKTSISATISNLSEQTISGEAYIECFDPVTEKVTILVPNNSQPFTLEAGKTSSISWTFDVPSGIDLTGIRVVAKSPDFSDGEQHLIPVLPNKMLVTESLPLNVLGGKTKTYQLNKLAKNNSSTLENYRLTLEFTSNPIWYAVQALPTITNPTSDDAVSWFAAFYGNSLATYIANSTPKLKQIIDLWTKQGGDKETLVSNLEKNQELKMTLLEETPWVLQAENETEQKQRLSLLFDINRSASQNNKALEKLQSLQTWDGGWTWFPGMEANVSITQWILYGMANLRDLNAISFPDEVLEMQKKAIGFIDTKFQTHFENLKKNNKNWKSQKTLSSYELEYLFVRSKYNEIERTDAVPEAYDFYFNMLKNNWQKLPAIYNRAIAAVTLRQNGETKTADSILKSLREHASHSEELGMYWANLRSNAFMFQSATCNHTFVMEAFDGAGTSSKEMDQMKLWLLKQKQVQEWESTPATVNAIYILLKTGSNWLEDKGNTTIQWGKQIVDMQKAETATGYIKESIQGTNITPDKAKIEIVNNNEGPAWGALYWQYYETLDKISSSKTGLNVEKSLFIEKTGEKGKELIPVNEQNPAKVGDRIIVRLTVRSDRDFEYVHLKDMRASAFEPLDQLSGVKWAQGTVYYQSTKDASTNYYFYNLPKGTYVFEYTVFANRIGNYSNGLSTIQCLYAPEFVSHTAGERIIIE